MTFLKTGAYFLSAATIIPIRTGVVRDIRNQLYQKITALPLGFFSEERKGDIIARMSGDVQEIENSIMASLEMLFKNPILIVSYFAALIFISWELTLFTLISTSGGLMLAEFTHHRVITSPRFVTTRHRHAECYKFIDELCKVKITFSLRYYHTFTIVGIFISQLHVQLVCRLDPQFEVRQATVVRHNDRTDTLYLELEDRPCAQTCHSSVNGATLYESINLGEKVIANLVLKGLAPEPCTQQINLISVHNTLLDCKGKNLFSNNDEKSLTFSPYQGKIVPSLSILHF
jgi:ABC-type multidrug transport system fused ATPase/permease subunit